MPALSIDEPNIELPILGFDFLPKMQRGAR